MYTNRKIGEMYNLCTQVNIKNFINMLSAQGWSTIPPSINRNRNKFSLHETQPHLRNPHRFYFQNHLTNVTSLGPKIADFPSLLQCQTFRFSVNHCYATESHNEYIVMNCHICKHHCSNYITFLYISPFICTLNSEHSFSLPSIKTVQGKLVWKYCGSL